MLGTGRNIECVVRDNLCTGCGTCAGVCPVSAIVMIRGSETYEPRVDTVACLSEQGCGVCYKCCPGHSLNLVGVGGELFGDARGDYLLGQYLETLTSHATDYGIRYHSASGGVVTQVLLWMLDTSRIDGAVVTSLGGKHGTEPRVSIATTREELIAGHSSKYCPVSLNQVIRKIRRGPGRMAIVGLPCHIHGFRKAEARFPDLKRLIHVYIGLFCSSTKTFGALEYLFRLYEIEARSVRSFSYRDEGCLGNMVVKLEDGSVVRKAYTDYYPRLRSFFIPRRCTLCMDQTSELADISVGDIHVKPFSEDHVGISALVVRSNRGQSILNDAKKAGAITLSHVDKETIVKSQWPMLERKKYHMAARQFFWRVSGGRVCRHDLDLPRVRPSLWLRYFWSSLVLYAEMAIGRRHKLWGLIGLLEKLARKLRRV